MSSLMRLERLLPLALILSLLVMPSSGSAPSTGNVRIDPRSLAVLPAAVPTWPRSTSILVSEVVTGAASASDEFVELYNAGAAAVELAGHELVYITASGVTVTRKQTWSALLLEPGRHLLLANSSGAYASVADGLYSGGLAGTGGSLALRTLDGVVVDSLSWGDAGSGFVEGTAGPAPAPASSLERRPGGAAGNAVDTNDNLTDSRVEPNPLPQGLGAPAVPAPTSPPTAWPSAPPASPNPPATTPPDPTLAPDPTLVVDPTLLPDPTLPASPAASGLSSPSPSDPPSPVPTAAATGEPGTTPTPSAMPDPTLGPPPPSPAPSPSPVPLPTTAPSPTLAPPLAISTARGLAGGSSVTVQGLLTTPLGLTETGDGAFVEDATGGIAIYLASGDWPPLPAGTTVTVTGVIDSRFSQLTLRLGSASGLVAGDPGTLPAPAPQLTGLVAEGVEGRLIVVEGAISEAASTLADGFSTAIDDGSGGLRVVVAAATGIAAESLPRGSRVRLTGVVGQRDSSGTGAAGYRLHLRSPADVVALPSPSPTPSPAPTPGPSAAPTPQPSPSPSRAPSPSPSATPTPAPATPTLIATARSLELDVQVTIRGVVTVRPGLILGDRTIAIQDATGGICVRVPADASSGLTTGRLVEVSGVLASPFGNLELRASETGMRVVGNGSVPAARPLEVAELGEATEGLLARITGTIRRIESSSTSVTVIVEDESGEGRVFIHRAVGLDRAHFSVGRRVEVTGIVGDRSGLYRLWPRDPSDVRLLSGSAPKPTPSASPGPSGGGAGGGGGGTPASPLVTIAQALRRPNQSVTVEGTVTAPPGLLDSDARRVTLQDATGAVLVRLPADAASVALGQRLRVTGKIGTYYGAPQIAAEEPPARLGGGSTSAAQVARAPISASLEWRLVTVTGDVVSVHRAGEAWRAEVAVTGGNVLIIGLARSKIEATSLAAGHRATIRGLVKRPHPTASDERYAIVPRSPADVALGASIGGPASPRTGTNGTGSGANGAHGPILHPTDPGHSDSGGTITGAPGDGPDVALADLGVHVGALVRVGGRLVRLNGTILIIEDGTGSAAVRLTGPAAAVATDLVVGAVVNASGTVHRTAGGALEVVVDDPAVVQQAVFGQPLVAGSSLAPVAPKEPFAETENLGGPTALSRPPLALVVALLSLAAAALGMVGIWLTRRHAAARRSAERVAARLPGQSPP